MMIDSTDRPRVVAFVDDLMFGVRLDKTLTQLGYDVEWVGDAASLGPQNATESRPGEPLSGRLGRLVDRLTTWQPALLIFDLGNTAVPWRVWLPVLKSSAATRRIPTLCYGAHVDKETLQTARDLGADKVVPRSRLAASLPELVTELARAIDHAAIATACAEELSPAALAGLAAFNAGDYYDAHEELETAWMADDGPARDLYRAVLQIAVAYYQIQRGNYNGALKMFLRARQWLDALPARCRGVDVAALRADAERVRDALRALGPEDIGDFDQALFAPVPYDHNSFDQGRARE